MKRVQNGLFLLLLLLCAGPALAQLGVYGEFSTADLNLPNTPRLYGSTFGLYYDRWHAPFLSAGIDGRGSVLGSGSPVFNSGLLGPRVAFRPHVIPLQPYVEVLIGGGHAEFGEGFSYTSVTKFEYQFLGGVDWTILPRIDWRVVEFSYGGLSGLNGSFNPKTLSTGIVFRLP